jgi:rhodanese-related sulfurtransferase
VKVVIIFLFQLLFFLTAQAQVQSTAYDLMLKALLSHDVKEVSVMQAKQSHHVLFLDARELKEYNVSHIRNARHVGYDNFNIQTLDYLNKKQPIIVYCSVGYRSEKIAGQLVKAGFTQVANLYGGIFEWVNQGNEVVNLNGEKTDRVHAYSNTWGVWLNKGTKVYDK